MEQITISIFLPRSAALATGRTMCGDSEYQVTSSLLAALSPAARKVLEMPPTRLHVAEYDEAAIVAALEAEAAKRATAEFDRSLKLSEEIAAARRGAERGTWLWRDSRDGEPRFQMRDDEGDLLSSAAQNDPRLAETMNRMRAEYERLHAAWEADKKKERAERDALEAAEKEQEARAKEAAQITLRAIAATFDDLARAARENYPIGTAVLDRLANNLADSVEAKSFEVDSTAWDPDNYKERTAPSPESFALLDRVAAAVRAANELLPTALGGKWIVSRIVRIDACHHHAGQHLVTAVLATLETLVGTREVTWSTEDMACDHAREDDED